MKMLRLTLWAVVAAGLGARPLGAQLAVAIALDPERDMHWAVEDGYWQSLTANAEVTAQNSGAIAQNTEQLVQSTNELLIRLGRTSSAVSGASATIPTSTQTLTTAVGLDSRDATLSTATQRYSLNQVPLDDKNNAAYAVSATYEVFGQQQKRDDARYSSFAAQQALNDRFQKAAENAEQVEAEELKMQAEAVNRLKSATTQAEIEVCNLAVEASKGRLDLAHAKMNQAKAEMDEYQVKIGIEKDRKAEADREWTEAVVFGLRARALKAYSAQSAGSDDNG